LIAVVTGSRSWTDKEQIRKKLLEYDIHLVIHGGCPKGADALAQEVCKEEDIPVEKCKAKWDKYGRVAGFIRNAEMLDEYKPDIVLAFWDGESPGTSNCIKQASFRGIKLDVSV